MGKGWGLPGGWPRLSRLAIGSTLTKKKGSRWVLKLWEDPSTHAGGCSGCFKAFEVPRSSLHPCPSSLGARLPGSILSGHFDLQQPLAYLTLTPPPLPPSHPLSSRLRVPVHSSSYLDDVPGIIAGLLPQSKSNAKQRQLVRPSLLPTHCLFAAIRRIHVYCN